MNENTVAGYSYLIVDDDQFICSLIATALRKHNATRVEIASSSKAALQRVGQDPVPDIIICDLNMPEPDGVEFVHYLTEQAFGGGIIVISGSDKVILNAVIRLGQAHALKMLGSLTKPFEPDALFALIARYETQQYFPGQIAEN